MKNHNKLFVFFLAVITVFTFLTCEGPMGPQGEKGEQGPPGISSGDDLMDIIIKLIDETKAANGGIYDGSTEEKAFTLKPSGFNLLDDAAMKTLFFVIEDYWVHLDLSNLTGSVIFHIPSAEPIDKSKILSVTLSSRVTTIADAVGILSPGAFGGFTGLKTFNSDSIVRVGRNAFSDCTSLSSVSLPAATNIGDGAFRGCTSLSSVNLPVATNIGNYAFQGCTSLSSVSLPVAKNIGNYAFNGCTSLSSVSLPVVTNIGHNVFWYCTSLSSVSLPAVITIGFGAFSGCTSLSTVSLPAATNIGDEAFNGCTSLSTLSLPVVTTIGNHVFYDTGTRALDITMGPVAPTVGVGMFLYINFKNVTVRVPAGATGYGTSPTDNTTNNWGNAFRFMGWDPNNADWAANGGYGDIWYSWFINLIIEYMP
jgi:hypothetical protein